MPASLAQSDACPTACPTGDQEVAGSIPLRVRQHSFVETDHEIFSAVSERMRTRLLRHDSPNPSADLKKAVVSSW